MAEPYRKQHANMYQETKPSIIRRYPVASFISMTLLAQLGVVLCTWWLIPEGQAMHSDTPGARIAHMVFRMRVFFPLLLAIAFTVYLDGWRGLRTLFGSFLHWRVPVKWYAIAVVWKFVLGYLGVTCVVLLALDQWPGFINEGWLEGMRNTFFFLIGIAFVEETSWIRFSVTRLQEKRSALYSATVVGLAWGAWYLMMMLLGEGVPDGIPWFAFVISMFSMSVFFTFTYNSTRSGAVLLIMQFFSNSAFLIAPMLPVEGKPPYFMIGFVLWFLILAIGVILYSGHEHLHRGGVRARWSDAGEGTDVDDTRSTTT